MNPPADENPYKSPEFVNPLEKPDKATQDGDKLIRKLLIRGIIQTFITQFTAMCILDGGEIAKRWALALVGSWIATLLIILRYHFGQTHLITRLDVWVMRYSVFPLFVIVLLGEGLLWRIGFIHY